MVRKLLNAISVSCCIEIDLCACLKSEKKLSKLQSNECVYADISNR